MRPHGGSRRAAWLGSLYSSVAVALLLLATSCGAGARPNIVLVVVDTLRADLLGAYGFAGPISEHLDRLAAESLLFENAFAPAPWTKPAVASMLTSLYPQVHGITNHDGFFWGESSDEEARLGVLSDRATTLAESLQAAGYATAAFISNPWLKAEYGFAQGFDHYDDSLSERFLEQVESVPADEVGDAAQLWLEGRDAEQPFFLYLHLMDVHSPYGVHSSRADFDALVGSRQVESRVVMEEAQTPHRTFNNVERRPEWATDDMRRTVSYWRTRYAAGVRGMDQALSGFLDHLRESGRLDDSYFVLTSDHGEELFEHGGWIHGQSLYFHQLHIPLFIRPPGGLLGGRRVAEIVDLMDLTPTLLSIAGTDPIPQAQGQDVSAFFDGEVPELRAASYATATQPSPGLHSVRTVDHKFIFDLDADTAQLFDVLDDPTERRNHGDSADWEKVVSQLTYQVTTHIGDSLVNGTLTSETTEISDEMLERLRSLGYVR